ncbi:WhiB family transcriptional regulator [Actinomycetospora sp. SF1]|nr:WhiB family transcriptional regulator [Actinomycetospora soli]
MFYPDNGQTAGAAKRICTTCPVRAACLSVAVATGERWGVWGGTTEDERRAIRRRQREAA